MVGDKLGLLLLLSLMNDEVELLVILLLVSLWMDDEVDLLVVMLLVVVAMRVISFCVVLRS